MPHDRLSRRQQKKKRKKLIVIIPIILLAIEIQLFERAWQLENLAAPGVYMSFLYFQFFFSSNVVMIVSTSTIVITEACQGEISQLFM